MKNRIYDIITFVLFLIYVYIATSPTRRPDYADGYFKACSDILGNVLEKEEVIASNPRATRTVS